jgi:hypothetical protein
MALPVVVFPDVEEWATGWLDAALAARPESYASGVTVRNRIPAPKQAWPMPFVWVRRDGGARLDVAREAPRLAVNVYAAAEQDVADLANLVRALLWSAPDGDPVCRVTELSGPSPIPDSRPRRFMTFELIVRGVQA